MHDTDLLRMLAEVQFVKGEVRALQMNTATAVLKFRLLLNAHGFSTK